MGTISNLKNKIDKDKYYVVDFRNPMVPELYRNKFNDEDEAHDAIVKHLKSNFKDYTIILGEQAIMHGLRFRKRRRSIPNEFSGKDETTLPVTKWDYPSHIVDWVQRKNYRTIQRRKLKNKKDV